MTIRIGHSAGTVEVLNPHPHELDVESGIMAHMLNPNVSCDHSASWQTESIQVSDSGRIEAVEIVEFHRLVS